ncbi:MAG: hypothetical protein GAK40_00221 [Burkholderia plantarii]|nr:MAG: hypothetical protein GAK40_00221 [Burkholderia plantarii]
MPAFIGLSIAVRIVRAMPLARVVRALCTARRSAIVTVTLATLVAGCSPALDWRTLHSEAGYTVDLPAKPTVDARQIDFDGTEMTMRVQAAHVDGAVFAVGTVTLPDARPTTQQAVLDALRTGLSRNLRAQPAERAIAVPLSAGGSVPGVELGWRGQPAASSASSAGAATERGDAANRAEGKTVVARLAARGAHVYQIVVVSDVPLASETLDQFFGSLKLD